MTVQELIAHWRGKRQVLVDALNLLPEDKLHWTPRPELWSVCQRALHVAGAEDGWLRHVLTGELDDWPAPYMGTGFLVEAFPTVAALQAHLAEVHARTEAYLRELSDADLARTIETSWGQTYSLEEAFRYVLDHELHHRGEIFLMLGLLGIEAPGF